MKVKNILTIVAIFAIGMSITSCVSLQKYNDLAARCGEETLMLNNKIEEMEAGLKDVGVANSKLNKDMAQLKKDTADLVAKLRLLTSDYNELDNKYENLKTQYNLNYHDAEKTMGELKSTQDELMQREAKLSRLEKDLNEKIKNINELQSILSRKDSITKALRLSVANALTGFEGKGLTVHTKEGKVYVSLDEKLLFDSGKWDVSAEGTRALKDLAKVLEQNPDISILIEGHTDNVPLKGINQVKDNWDLSVMRATSIVKILLNNGNINPTRLTASGRSEYLPVVPNTTAQNKAKNRRTEIILSPKLDELMKIIGN